MCVAERRCLLKVLISTGSEWCSSGLVVLRLLCLLSMSVRPPMTMIAVVGLEFRCLRIVSVVWQRDLVLCRWFRLRSMPVSLPRVLVMKMSLLLPM